MQITAKSISMLWGLPCFQSKPPASALLLPWEGSPAKRGVEETCCEYSKSEPPWQTAVTLLLIRKRTSLVHPQPACSREQQISLGYVNKAMLPFQYHIQHGKKLLQILLRKSRMVL